MSKLDQYYKQRHEMIELPCVRIRTPKAGGSGTALYSRVNGDGGYSTYVLTNHHVVENCISIDKEWSTLRKTEVKIDKFEMVDAHFFEYKWDSRAIGGTNVQSDIVAYDKNEDLALLKLRSGRPAAAVAKLYPRGEEDWLRVGMPVVTVGAGLGAPPVQTFGFLAQFGQEIDRREYWLNTAPSIFGNSGGAMFLAHLSFAIPMTRIYNFLEEQCFRFIYDDEHTEESEAEERQRIRDDEERRQAAKD
jgi:S1-C subfamily serine protease